MNLHNISGIFDGKHPYGAFPAQRITLEFYTTTSAELKERFREVVGTEEEMGYTFDICYLSLYESIKEWGSSFIGQSISNIQPIMYKSFPDISYTLED